MGTEKNVVLFESADGKITLDVGFDGETVWLSQAQMAELFATTKQNVSLHVNNCFREGELEPEAVVKDSLTTAADGKRYRVRLYNLDVIISVGYRVKSSRGVEFRRWATDVLRRYVVAGHAENERRLEQLGQVAKIMARVPESLESRQILDIVQSYTGALDLLDDYDHLSVTAPEGTPATREITYDECHEVIESLRFGRESSLFGVEKDDSLKGAVGNVFQSFGGREGHRRQRARRHDHPCRRVKARGEGCDGGTRDALHPAGLGLLRQARKASRAVRPAARRSITCCMWLPGPSATSTPQPCARRISAQAARSSST